MIFLGHADNEAQVGGHHAVPGPLGHAQLAFVLGGALCGVNVEQTFAGLHMVGKLNFFGGCQQGHPSNGAQIPANRIGAKATTLAWSCWLG